MKKSKFYGIIGTTVFAIVVFLLFLLVKLPFTQSSYSEPIYINLGDANDGVGVSVPSPAMSAIPTKSEKQTSLVSTHQNVLTQVENSPVSMPETKKKKIKTEISQKENIEKKNDQKLAEEAFQKAKLAKQESEKQAINRARKLGSVFGTDQGHGGGSGQGDAVQGNPLGVIGGNGVSVSVSGRSPLYIPSPSYQSNDEGVVTVHVMVDQNGNVSNAYIGASTTTNQTLRNAALEAARKSKFSKGNHDAIGTIIYHFILK